MNATKMTDTTDNADVASILKQCANAMMAGQLQQQERQQTFEATIDVNMAAMQKQLNNAASRQQQTSATGMQQLQMQLQAMNMANAAAQNNNPNNGNWQPQWPTAQQHIMPACPPAYPNNPINATTKIRKHHIVAMKITTIVGRMGTMWRMIILKNGLPFSLLGLALVMFLAIWISPSSVPGYFCRQSAARGIRACDF